MSYWEPDDPPEIPDGWLSDDEVATLRALLDQVDMPDPPRAGSRSDAALVMLDYHLRIGDNVNENDPHLVWARHLLKDIL